MKDPDVVVSFPISKKSKLLCTQNEEAYLMFNDEDSISQGPSRLCFQSKSSAAAAILATVATEALTTPEPQLRHFTNVYEVNTLASLLTTGFTGNWTSVAFSIVFSWRMSC